VAFAPPGLQEEWAIRGWKEKLKERRLKERER